MAYLCTVGLESFVLRMNLLRHFVLQVNVLEAGQQVSLPGPNGSEHLVSWAVAVSPGAGDASIRSALETSKSLSIFMGTDRFNSYFL